MKRTAALTSTLAIALALASPAAAQPVKVEPEPTGTQLQPVPWGPAQPPPPLPKKPWEHELSVGATFGILDCAYVGLFDEQACRASPYVAGALDVLWRKPEGRLGLGLRVSAQGTIGLRVKMSSDDWKDEDPETCYWDGRYVAGGLGFLLSVSHFWVSPGIGFASLSQASSGSCGKSYALPMLMVGIGYDIPLGRHLALRLEAAGATLFVLSHGYVGGGPVVRF